MTDAKQVFEILCKAIDNREWKYQKEEENMTVYFDVIGDDLLMRFMLKVDEDRKLIRLLSPMPFEMSEAKRMEGAIATCVATYGLADGSFDYDLSDGSIVFRMTASFRDSVIGEGLLQYMISCSRITVEQYNDKFLAIDKGILSIADFLSEE